MFMVGRLFSSDAGLKKGLYHCSTSKYMQNKTEFNKRKKESGNHFEKTITKKDNCPGAQRLGP